MKESELRSLIRKQIMKEMNENPERFRGASRSALGGGAATALDSALKKVDMSGIARLGRTQKMQLLVRLLTNIGITASDFDKIKSAVGRNLADTIGPADESIEEKKDFELAKAKGGVTNRDLGGASAVNRAKPFLSAISALKGSDKERAIGYVLSQMGVNVQDFEGMKSQIKTSIRKYK